MARRAFVARSFEGRFQTGQSDGDRCRPHHLFRHEPDDGYIPLEDAVSIKPDYPSPATMFTVIAMMNTLKKNEITLCNNATRRK